MVLPGAPRKPSSCALGLCQSPMQAKFWLPYWSIWLPPIITWRRPFQSTVNICGYGFQASTTSSSTQLPVVGLVRVDARRAAPTT